MNSSFRMIPFLLLLSILGVWADKRSVWDSLPTQNAIVNDGKTLLFVSAIWRHGDRSPTEKAPGDHLNEDDWDLGGGGYGQLSPFGMQQHFTLGRRLRSRYITNISTPFLSKTYSAKEIYVRATDVNRTLISAMSNMAGMYSNTGDQRNGIDLPDDVPQWPSGYVPIPIHTELRPLDYIANPDASCKRQDQLWQMAHETNEYKAYNQGSYCQTTLEYLRNETGVEITFDNIWKIRDMAVIETQHFGKANTSEWYPWYNDAVDTRVKQIDNQNIDFQNGIFENGVLDNGLDLKIEIPKIRGGALLREVKKTAEGVMDCYAKDHLGQGENASRCTDGDKYLKSLKYFVVSAHDTTVTAYLTVLGAKKHVIEEGGYPHYASTVLTEFYYDNTTNKNVFKVLFYMGDMNDTIHGDAPFKVITSLVDGCPIGPDFCPVEVLYNLSNRFDPGDVIALCNTPPVGYTTVSPPSPAPNNSSSPHSSPPTVSPPQTTTAGASSLQILFISFLVILFTKSV